MLRKHLREAGIEWHAPGRIWVLVTLVAVISVVIVTPIAVAAIIVGTGGFLEGRYVRRVATATSASIAPIASPHAATAAISAWATGRRQNLRYSRLCLMDDELRGGRFLWRPGCCLHCCCPTVHQNKEGKGHLKLIT